MAVDEKIIYVYDSFSEDEPCLIGRLYVGVIKGGETYSFEYDAGWLTKNKMRTSLDPQLQPFVGRQFYKEFCLQPKYNISLPTLSTLPTFFYGCTSNSVVKLQFFN